MRSFIITPLIRLFLVLRGIAARPANDLTARAGNDVFVDYYFSENLHMTGGGYVLDNGVYQAWTGTILDSKTKSFTMPGIGFEFVNEGKKFVVKEHEIRFGGWY